MKELFPTDAEAPNHFEEPLSRHDAQAAAQIAQELLSRTGWTGAQMNHLERLVAMESGCPDSLHWVENLRDARDREDALKS